MSNIAAGPDDQVAALVNSHAFERMFFVAKSYNIDNRKEALWVLCNAITGSDP